MTANQFYQLLDRACNKPQPFEFYTAEELWTDEHTSKRMLEYHLDFESGYSSRKIEFIERSVKWIVSEFALGPDKSVADFGCGPGLYASRLARSKASVTGIDFSSRSIDYARSVAAKEKLDIEYVTANYLDFETSARFDLILLIMCDYCSLSPEQRNHLLHKFHELLKPGGAVLLDVYSLNAFDKREESQHFQKNLLDGFWAPDDYYAFLNVFKYDDAKVILDKYTIFEKERTKEVYNWQQCFNCESLQQEFEKAGFSVEKFISDVAGGSFDADADEFAVIARK